MKLKRILALAVSLAMVLSIVPAFGLTASAANFGEGATNLSIEFTVVGPTNGQYKDIALTDADGRQFTSFVIAEDTTDGFFAFDRVKSYVQDVEVGKEGGAEGGNGGTQGNNPNGVKYTSGVSTVKIEVVNTPEPPSYTVTMSINNASVPGFYRTQTYTGKTVNGIATPDKWDFSHQGSASINAANIYDYLQNPVITVDGAETKSFKQKVNYTYEGEAKGDPFESVAAFEGYEVTVPEHKETLDDGTVLVWNAQTVALKSAEEPIDIEPDVVIKDGVVAHYSFADGTAKDETGNFDGTITGSGLTVKNGIANFPGGTGEETSHIELPDEIIKNIDGDFTVSMWINQDTSDKSYKNDGSVAMWEMAHTNSNYDRLYYSQGGDGNAKAFTIRNRSNDYPAQSTAETDAMKDKWALVTTVFDLTNGSAKAYINGDELTLTDADKTTWDADRAPSKIYERSNGNPRVFLGHNAWSNDPKEAPNNPDLKGGMADVYIYNKALTQDDVKALLNAKHTATIKYEADGVTLDETSEDVVFFTEEGEFELPATITGEGKTYVPENGQTTVTVTSEEKEKSVKYVVKPDGYKQPEKVTVIDGNDPVLPRVMLTSNGADAYEADVEWDTTGLTVGETKEITGKTVGYGGMEVKVQVEVLECNDDTLAGVIESNDGGDKEQIKGLHKFATAMDGDVTLEFDLTYGDLQDTLNTDAGSAGVFFGNTAAKPDKGSIVPAYSNGGNAIGIQGVDKSFNFAFKNGGNKIDTSAKFTATPGETYRVLVTTNVATNKYTAVVRDKTGKIIYNQTYDYRDKDLGAIDAIVVSTNGKNKGVNGGIEVANLRVSWPGGTEYTVNAKCEGEDIEEFEPYTQKFINDEYAKQGDPGIRGYIPDGEPTVAYNTVTFNYKKVNAASRIFDYSTNKAVSVDEENIGYKFGTDGRVLAVEYDVAGLAPEGEKIKSADLYFYPTFFNNDKSSEKYNFTVYVPDSGVVDFDAETVAADYTSSVKGGTLNNVWPSGSDNEKITPNEFAKITLDLSNANVGDTLVILVATNHDLNVAGDNYKNGGFLPYIDIIDTQKGYYVTVDGETQIVSEEAAAEFEVQADEGVVAFADAEGNLYKVTDGKATIEVTSDLVLESKKMGVELLDGAQVRIGEAYNDGNVTLDQANSGLRFIGKVERADTLAGMEKAEISVVITAAGDESNSVPIVIDKYQDGDHETDGTVFTAVLTNIKKGNYNRVFTATPVVTIGENKYEGTPVKRSIYEVAAGILVSGNADQEVPEGEKYELDSVVKAVLNAYVNAVGVRFGWDKGSNAAKTEGNEEYYKYGKTDTKTVFFDVASAADENGKYTVTVTPKNDNVVIDEATLTSTIRINNNNKKVALAIENVQVDEDGVVTFTFDPNKAAATE